MMANLVRIIDGAMIWPYSLGQLRLDEPAQSFSWAPSDAELAHYGVHRVEPSDPPVADPALEKVIQAAPSEIDGKLVQQWELVPLTAEEQAAYYAATHPPRWLKFGQMVQAEPKINALLSRALINAPALAMALSVGLGKAADGDSRIFLGAWNSALGLGLIDAELITLMQDAAQAHDLPAEFTTGLAGGVA
jgi:hypothetical protein